MAIPLPERERATIEAPASGLRVAALFSLVRNPYGQLLYAALAEHGVHLVTDSRLELGWLWRQRRHVTFLHFHWDEWHYEPRSPRRRFRALQAWLKMAHFASMLALARILGYRIIWTVHEVLPHESPSPRRDLVAARMLARASHVLMAHDQATATRATGLLRPGIKMTDVIPHGSYVGAYPPGRPRALVREEWGLRDSSFVFLAFGNLRSYKRLDLLLDAFARVADPDVALVIAGEFVSRFPEPEWVRCTLARLQGAAERDPRIRCRIGTVPVAEVAELHDACDAAVFGRSDGWTSGSMILALSQGLPVIAARRPAYVELLGDSAAGWLYEPGDVNSLSDTLTLAAAEPDRAREKGHQAGRRGAALGWQGIAAGTAAVMMSTLSNGHS